MITTKHATLLPNHLPPALRRCCSYWSVVMERVFEVKCSCADESVQCDPQMMHVFFEFDQPFRGAIYAEGHHDDPRCRIYGEGTSFE